jgi:hypothetical protein
VSGFPEPSNLEISMTEFSNATHCVSNREKHFKPMTILWRAGLVSCVWLLGIGGFVGQSAQADSPAEEESYAVFWELPEKSEIPPFSAQHAEFIRAKIASDPKSLRIDDVLSLSLMASAWRSPAAVKDLLDYVATLSSEFANTAELSEARARLALELGQLEASRTLYQLVLSQRQSDGELECEEDEQGLCDPRVRHWITTGSVPTDIETQLGLPAVFDERRITECRDWDTSGLNIAQIMAIDANPLKRAHKNLRIAWAQTLLGCRSAIDDALEVYTEAQLQQAVAEAKASLNLSKPYAFFTLGVNFPLPRQECDFTAASDCSIGKPLTPDTAQRLLGLFSEMSYKFKFEISQCVDTPEGEWERREALEKTFQAAVQSALKKPMAERLVALRSLLRLELKHVNVQSDWVGVLDKLGDEDGEAAISLASEVLDYYRHDADLSDDLELKLAELYARADDLPSALALVERGLARSYSTRLAQAGAELRALSHASNRATELVPSKVTRPWVYGQDGMPFEPMSDNQAKFLTMADRKVFLAVQSWTKVLGFLATETEYRQYVLEEFREECGESCFAGVRQQGRELLFPGLNTPLPLPDALCLVDCEKPYPLNDNELKARLKELGIGE